MTDDQYYFDLVKNAQLKVNDKWFIVNKEWFDKWSASLAGKLSKNSVGKINNYVLLNGNKQIKDEILLADHYELVPEEVWNFLVKQYGVDIDNNNLFARNVIETADDYKIDVRPLTIKISINGKDKSIVKQFSRHNLLKDIYDCVEKELGEERPMQILQKLETGEFDILNLDEDVTIDAAGLGGEEHIFIESVNKEDGIQKTEYKPGSLKGSFSRNGKLLSANGHTIGVCGLCNLGNTCFMNSALQCISNVPPLTYYFMRTNWRADLNFKNPLGMQGRLAERYYQLMEQIWVHGSDYTVPREFKVEVAKFAPQFSGYAQHDSQELMMFLLDGLHEDLNRIQKKPYMETSDDDSVPIVEKARQAWRYHCSRNDSIIVENFHGLLKSTVVCPDCQYVSITFDPFASLSLPLVMTYPQEFTIVTQNEIKEAQVLLSKSDNVRDFTDRIKQEVLKLPASSNESSKVVLKVTELAHGQISKIFQASDSVILFRDAHVNSLVVYELSYNQVFEDCEELDKNSTDWLELFVREAGTTDILENTLPILIPIYKRNFDWYTLKQRIWRRLPVLNELPSLNGSTGIENGAVTRQQAAAAANHFTKSSVNNTAAIQQEYEAISRYLVLYLTQKNSSEHQLLSPGSLPKIAINRASHQLILEYAPAVASALVPSLQASLSVQQSNDTNFLSNSSNNRPVLNLQACIMEFLKTEKLSIDDLWYCKRCKQQKQATKKFDLWRLPKVLVLHLKRFRSGYYRRDKIESFVDFPTSDLNLHKFVEQAHLSAQGSQVSPPDYQHVNQHESSPMSSYDLVAVSNHMGGLGGGHYTAFVKNFIDGEWYLFDDSHTSKIRESSIKTKSAYVLVYVSQSALEETRSKISTDMMNGEDFDMMDTDY